MPYFKIKEKKKPTTIVKILNNLTGRWVTLKENKRKKKDKVSAAPSQPNTVIATSSQQPIPTTSSINVEPLAVVIAASSQQPIPTTSSINVEPMAVVIAASSQQPIPTTSSINVEPMAVVIAASSQQPIPTTSSIDVEPMAVVIAASSQQPIPTTSSINVEPMAVVIAASSQQPIPTTSSIDVEPMAVGRALGKKGRNLSFPYKKHFLAPVVKVTGMPEGVEFKHPSKYTVSELKKIIANKAHIKMELIAPSVAEEPSLCAADVQQTPVVAHVFMASDPPSEVVQTTLVQDMEEAPISTLQHSTVKKNSAKQHQESGVKNQRTGFRTLWTAEEVLIVQQHFSQELAGLKPVSRSSIESFLAQQTVVKRTSTAVGNYLLRNRKKKNRPNDQ